MNNIEKWETRDPLEVLIRRERHKCTGCRFLNSDRAFGQVIESCGLGRRKVRKCSLFAQKMDGNK